MIINTEFFKIIFVISGSILVSKIIDDVFDNYKEYSTYKKKMKYSDSLSFKENYNECNKYFKIFIKSLLLFICMIVFGVSYMVILYY